MPPPTPSLASSAAMPTSVRSVSAPAHSSRNSSAVCTAMFGEGEQRLAAEHVARQAQPADQQATTIASTWCSRAVRGSCANSSDRPNKAECARRWPAPCAAAAAPSIRRQGRERELVEVDVPAGGVAQQDRAARSRRAARRRAIAGTRASAVASHSATPASTKRQRRQPHHARPAGHDVGELLHVERPAGEHEQAHDQRDERGESCEESARFRAFRAPHGESNYSDARGAAIGWSGSRIACLASFSLRIHRDSQVRISR